MDLNSVIEQICAEAGISSSVSSNVTNVKRNIALVLQELDPLAIWRCAIVDFSKTVSANDNKTSVSNVNLFKALYCTWTDSDSILHKLTYREITNFWLEHIDYGSTTTNTAPTLYTISGGYIYVGPGLMAANTTVGGKVQRRLTENDVPELPAPLVVDGVVKRISKAGSPESIRAWSGWNNSVKAIIQAAKKHTAEQRDVMPLDPIIARNMSYINSL